jgi:glycosyltransferase involved in cell wall biosynthesis
MVETIQLHRKAPYPPGSGADRRVWETSKKFSEFGKTWVAAPWTDAAPDRTVEPIDIGTVWLEQKVFRIYLWTVLMAFGGNFIDTSVTKRCVSALDRNGADPDLVISECPQTSVPGYQLAKDAEAAFLINKHNAEFDVVDQFLEGKHIPARIRRFVVDRHRAFEQAMIDRADAVVFMSEDDTEAFDLSGTRYDVIPNGTNFDEISSPGDQQPDVDIIGLDESSPVCIYVGAYDYEPNRIAARTIASKIAPESPGVQFLLVGRNPPEIDQANVLTPGFVDDLRACLGAADIAICPLTSGSGTKLKMLDYMAAGLPIVTTPIGAEGLDIVDGETALVRDSTAEFVTAIGRLVSSEEKRRTLGANAQSLGKQYDWSNLFEAYDPIVEKILD